MQDVEPFIDWLRTQGLTDEAQLATYRKFVDELRSHPSLSAALKAAEEVGASERHVANLRRTAARIVEFEAAQRGESVAEPMRPARATIEPAGRSGRSTGEPHRPSGSTMDARTAAVGAELQVETRTRAHTPSVMRNLSQPRRAGCVCNKRYDIYLDDDFGALARMFGGGIGIGTFVLIRLIGVVGALTLALGFAGMGGLVTITSICMRCEGCRRRVRDLDADEKQRVHTGRGRVTLITLGLLAGAALCGALWWAALKSAQHRQF